MTDLQHVDDIDIPDIEITEGWLARDVATIEDCDDAFALLTAACASIECQIDMEAFKPLAQQRGDWVAKAKAAFRFKKGALAIVQHKRSAINERLRNEQHAANEQTRAKRAMEKNARLVAFLKEAIPAPEWVRLISAFNVGDDQQDAA